MGDSTNAVVVVVLLVADDDDGMDVVVVYKFVVRHQLLTGSWRYGLH
jgi:hypothetical protein